MTDQSDSVPSTTASTSTAAAAVRAEVDPCHARRPDDHLIQDGDTVILAFADGRQVLAQCGRSHTIRIQRRTYNTQPLVGLSYGTVLEVRGGKALVALPPNEGLRPQFSLSDLDGTDSQGEDNIPKKDNRNLVDDNTSQGVGQEEVLRLVEAGVDGSTIVENLIRGSATFANKTEFSKAKYIKRKQMKYQQRCRLVRCSGPTICEAWHRKDPKRLMNLREDSLAQILSYSNVSAGCQTLVMETCLGIVTGAVAERMGGYGKVFSIYSGQQPSAWCEMIKNFNLSFAENNAIKWVHSGDMFRETNGEEEDEVDEDAIDRAVLQWPCLLQQHTRDFLSDKSDKETDAFLDKRCARFFRKLTRSTPMENKAMLDARQCDSIILACHYDPTETLFALLPYLAPSCPFVVYCEFMEPLVECFREIQDRQVAINLRLSDTWAREFQVLPGRTHPEMTMRQNGGFLLTGIKLDETHGINDMDEELLQEIRQKIGPRRGRHKPQNKRKSVHSKESSGGEDNGEELEAASSKKVKT